jgi:hypothetical protein
MQGLMQVFLYIHAQLKRCLIQIRTRQVIVDVAQIERPAIAATRL